MKKVVIVFALILVLSLIIPVTTKSVEVLGIATKEANNISNVTLNSNVLTDYENMIAVLINNTRASNGLGSLAADGSLNTIADMRSSDMLDRGYFSHYTPENTNVFDLMRANGVSFKYAGENLAQSAPASYGTAEGFLSAWMNSPTHKSNILGANYLKIGVSMIEVDSRRIVTTVFTN